MHHGQPIRQSTQQISVKMLTKEIHESITKYQKAKEHAKGGIIAKDKDTSNK